MESKRVLDLLLNHFGSADSDRISEACFQEQVRSISHEHLDAEGLRLAFDCLRGDPSAIKSLKELLERLASGLGRKLVRDEDYRAELCQETSVLLLYGGARYNRGYLATYGGRAPLRAWLRTALVRQGLAESRRRERESCLDGRMHRLTDEGSFADPELELLKRTYASSFGTALHQSLARLPERDRVVLRHHLVDNLTAEQIGRRFHVHRVTVARWMRNIRHSLFESTKAHLDALHLKETVDMNAIYSLVEGHICMTGELLPVD